MNNAYLHKTLPCSFMTVSFLVTDTALKNHAVEVLYKLVVLCLFNDAFNNSDYVPVASVRKKVSE